MLKLTQPENNPLSRYGAIEFMDDGVYGVTWGTCDALEPYIPTISRRGIPVYR